MTLVAKSSAFPKSVQAGIPKLGACPEGWSREPLAKHLIENQRPVKLTDDGLYDLVTVKRSRGGVIKRDRLKGSEISVKSQFQVKAGDFLISKRQIVHGACGLLPDDLAGSIVSNEYAILGAQPTIDLNFLNHLAHSIYFQQTCFHSSVGVHVEKMIFKLDRWLRWDFDLPPLSEQRRIAEILSTWDRAIETVEALTANARAQKKALMQNLLTAKKRLPGFSEHWDKLRIGVLADLFTGGTPSTAKPEYWGGNISWMSSGEINLREIHAVEGRITQRGLEESNAKMIPVNSVLIALAGQGKTRGKVAISRIPLCTNQSVATIVPNQKLSPDYLFHNLDSRYDELRSMSLGDGGRGGLNLSVLRSIQVPVPEIDEQIAIASILRSADEQVELLESKRAAFWREKSALLQQILTGKRRVKVNEREDA